MAIMSSDLHRELVICGRQGSPRNFRFTRRKARLEEIRCVTQVAGGTGALPTLSCPRQVWKCNIFGPGCNIFGSEF